MQVGLKDGLPPRQVKAGDDQSFNREGAQYAPPQFSNTPELSRGTR